jgi:hypothetical protein
MNQQAEKRGVLLTGMVESDFRENWVVTVE